MPAVKDKWYIEKGATFHKQYIYAQGTEESNTPIDITGYTARAKIRPSYAKAAIVELTTENGGITLGGAAGTVTVLIEASVTETLPGLAAIYDLELVNGTEVIRLVEGEVELSKEVTYD